MSVLLICDIFILFCLIFQEFNSKLLKKFGEATIIFIFFIIAGLSYKIHDDLYIYEKIYYLANLKNFNQILFEKGYIFLNIIFNQLINFEIFKILIYFINTILIYCGLKKITKKNITLIFAFLFFYSSFYDLFISAFRQQIAVSIFIYSLNYIKEKKHEKYIICILIASLFHKSAFIFIFLSFIFNYIKINKKYIILYLLIIFTALFFPIYKYLILFFLKMVSLVFKNIIFREAYFSLIFNFSLKTIIINLLVVVFYFLMYKKIKGKKNIFILKGYICYLFFVSLSKEIPIFYRFNQYLIIFYILMLTIIIDNIKNKFSKITIKYSIVIFFILNYNFLYFFSTPIYDRKYTPLYFYFEKFIKEIEYKNTAQYKKMLKRFGKSEINMNDYIKNK